MGSNVFDASSNLMSPLPIPKIIIDPLGSGVEGHNWVATLLEVPDNGHEIRFKTRFSQFFSEKIKPLG